VGRCTGKLKWRLLLNGRGGKLATPNYEGWSCPYGQSRFGAVTEVCGRILDNMRRRRVESQMKRSLAKKMGGCFVSCKRAWLNARISCCAWQLAELL
jgi:hypothetical protein